MQKISPIVFAATVRDATLQGIKLFLPMLVVIKGGSIAKGGMLLFVITMACTLAGIIGGRLADHRRRKVMLDDTAIFDRWFHTRSLSSRARFGFRSQASTSHDHGTENALLPAARQFLAMSLWGIANSLRHWPADIIG